MIALIYKRLLQLGKVAGALTFLFGIPYGVFKYLEAVRATKVEQTLKFFNVYNSPPITNYREAIITVLVNHESDIVAAAVDASKFNELIVNIVKTDQLSKPLLLTMDFFDGLAACVVNDLCDPDTTQRLFQRRAEEIYVMFYPYIMGKRSTTASWDFALGLETIAKTGRKAPRP
jgi:hypothetical protein